MSTRRMLALLAQVALYCMLCSLAHSRELKVIADPVATAPEATALSLYTPPVVAAVADPAAIAVTAEAPEQTASWTSARTKAAVATAVAATAAAQAADPGAVAAELSAGALATAALSSGLQANLDLHNMYRARHINTPPLSWDATVAASAATFAAGCAWGVSDSTNPYGENRYVTTVSNVTKALIDAINDWYGTIQYYNYATPGYQKDAGTFTQVVWASSLRLGCAGQSCPSGLSGYSSGRSFVVCRYSPGGNVINAGQFQANVQPLNTSTGGGTPPPAPSPSPAPPVTVAATAVSVGFFRTSSSSSPSGSGACWTSPNSIYKLCIRTNGRAELMKSGTTNPIWTSGSTFSTSSAPYKLTFDYDGRLKITNVNLSTRWTSSNTAYGGFAPYTLRIQNDGNVVIVDYFNTRLWQTNTVQSG